jgi:TM2 domain-containing membrane protein YozV
MQNARITIHSGDQNFGPYTLEQVNIMLATGQVSGNELAWLEGTPEWQTLQTIPGVVSPPPPRPQSASSSRRRDRDRSESDRQILPAFLLAFFLGAFGVHRFYVGKTGSGIAMLVLTLTVIGAIVTVIWATIDWIMIVCGNFTDVEGRRLTRWN